jgi:protein ImuB
LPLDRELARRVQLLDLKTVGQFAGLPGGAVLTQFGPQGRRLHRLARGLDDRPLRPWSPEPAEQVTRPFDSPVLDRVRLAATGRRLLETAAARLQAGGQVARTLHLVLHLENGAVWSDQVALRQPTGELARLSRLFETLLERVQIEDGVTGLTIRLAGLTPALGQQLPLFDDPLPLNRTGWWPALAGRFGPDRFFRPELLEPAAGLPEARFRLREVAEE